MITFEFGSDLPAGITAEHLKQVVTTAERVAKLHLDGSLVLSFVGQAMSRQLNQHYAQHDYATDVLSFAYREDTSESLSLPQQLKPSLGDIIICAPIAVKQATEHHSTLKAEVTLLLVHGILHIAGRDHQTAIDKTSFAQIQNAIMKELALPAREYLNDHTH